MIFIVISYPITHYYHPICPLFNHHSFLRKRIVQDLQGAAFARRRLSSGDGASVEDGDESSYLGLPTTIWRFHEVSINGGIIRCIYHNSRMVYDVSKENG